MAEIKELAYGFEAFKYALRQNKEGVAITLVVNPNDMPRDLLNDDIGQRYMIGMGKISDGEEIIEGDNAREARRLLISCGALCRDSDFQRWIEDNGFAMEASEEVAAASVRGLLKVKSRSEIKTDEEALNRFKRLRDLFIKRSTFEEGDL